MATNPNPQNVSVFTADIKSEFTPDIAAQDPAFRASAQMFGQAYQAFLAALPQLLIKPAINTLPDGLVDELAIEFGAVGYDQSMPIDQKRILVKRACYDNSIRGTPFSVQQLVNQVFAHAIVEEWWQYGGAPYHFRINTTDPVIDPVKVAKLNAAILATKPVSRWPDEPVRPRDVGDSPGAIVYLGAAYFRVRNRRMPNVTV